VAGERLVGGEGDGAVGSDEGRVSGWARGRKGSLMVACLPIALVLSFEDAVKRTVVVVNFMVAPAQGI
jgi:hypothetical protein